MTSGWSTNRGLVQYSPHTGYVVTYGYSYGLNTIEYSDGACFADPRTGTLFFGGIDGLVTIEDTGFREQEYNPPMLFRDIRLNDGIRNIGDMLSRDGVLTLRHGQRIFEITVSALDYVNGSNYSYYSRLDGYNDQWTGASSQLSFADLPADLPARRALPQQHHRGRKSGLFAADTSQTGVVCDRGGQMSLRAVAAGRSRGRHPPLPAPLPTPSRRETGSGSKSAARRRSMNRRCASSRTSRRSCQCR